jgi:hypothetical protein
MSEQAGPPQVPSDADHPEPPFEEWPYERLRDAAFDRARDRHDLGFFIELMAHTPALAATADEGGSLGEISGSLIETLEAARQAFRDAPGELEPLFRAVFATYLREHPEH